MWFHLKKEKNLKFTYTKGGRCIVYNEFDIFCNLTKQT